MKLDKMSSYLTTFSCPFCRYRCIRLPFRSILAGDMSVKKIDVLFSGMSNVADDILIAGFDEWGNSHD